MTKNFFAITFLFSGLALLSAPLASAVEITEEKQPGLISVTGTGIVKAQPDMATINLTVLREAKTARQALSENTAAMDAVLTAMKSHGIEDKDLQTSNFSINPRYIYPKASNGRNLPARIDSYQVSNSLTVRIRDLDKVGAVLDQSVSLGVNQGGQIIFGNADIAPLQMEARAAAMKNAIEKANVLLGAAGAELGKIKQISENGGNYRPQPIMRAEMALAKSVADAAPVPVAAGENAYSINVNVTFEIKQ